MSDPQKSDTAAEGKSKHGTASTDQREVLLAAAAGLQKSVEGLSEKIHQADVFANETRGIAMGADATNKKLTKVVKALVGIIIVLALTIVGVFANTTRANHANAKASVIQQYQTANCEAGNRSREDQAALWSTMIVLIKQLPTKDGKPDPALTQFTKSLQAKVDVTFLPRDCSQVVRGQVK
jgi:hypothetical protein